MGVSTMGIFGDRSSEPATPGSYGEAPRGYRLPDGTRLGHVQLQIADLSRSLAYYQGILGLQLLARDTSTAVLGAADQTPLVELRERPGAHSAPSRGRLGLFHFAILLPDRSSLGRFLQHVDSARQSLGAADHLVSESLYLRDPDNLGIEVYADRPRHMWRRVGRELMMATDPFDFDGVRDAAGTIAWSGMPAGTVMGHVHLCVGDLGAASAFFSEAMGLDRTVWDYPGALFLGAGGYHHTLGTNIWAGRGATAPPTDEAQLLEWTIALPDVASLDALGESLARSGYSADRDPSQQSMIRTRDPWGTRIRVFTQ